MKRDKLVIKNENAYAIKVRPQKERLVIFTFPDMIYLLIFCFVCAPEMSENIFVWTLESPYSHVLSSILIFENGIDFLLVAGDQFGEAS